MTIEELENEKQTAKKNYELLKSNVEQMEQTIEIQNYLKEVESKGYQQEYQQFLNRLEVGEDGTIFAPHNKYRYTTLGLSEFINYAFTLKYYGKQAAGNSNPYMFLTFNEISEYSESTQNILRQMKKYPDEKVVENPYHLDIYANPRENFQCAESDLLKNCIYAPTVYSFQEELEREGMADLVVDNREKKIIVRDDHLLRVFHYSDFDPVDISTLSMREQEAFFGEEAQRIFGVKLDTSLFKTLQEEGPIKKAPYTK